MSRKSIWNKTFLLLLLANICIATSFYMLNTTLAKHAASLGSSSAAAGFVSGIFSVSSLLARPFCGPLVDRLNRKKIIWQRCFWSEFRYFYTDLFARCTSFWLCVLFRDLDGRLLRLWELPWRAAQRRKENWENV